MNKSKKSGFLAYLHYGIIAVILLFSVALQSAANGGLSLFGISLLPAVAVVVAIGINYGPFIGGVYGLIGGLFLDVYTVPCVGFHLVSITVLGMGCGLLVNHFLMNNRYARFFLCFCAATFYCVSYFVVMKWMLGSNGFSYLYQFSLPMIGSCTLTCGVCAFFFKLLRGKL